MERGVVLWLKATFRCDQLSANGHRMKQLSEMLRTTRFGLAARWTPSVSLRKLTRLVAPRRQFGAQIREVTRLKTHTPHKHQDTHSPSSVLPAPPASLVLCDHHHHAHSEQQSQNLHHRLAKTGAAHQQLREHRNRGDVDEAAGGEGQDPCGRRRAHALRQQRANGAAHCSQRRQQLEKYGLKQEEDPYSEVLPSIGY